MAHRDAGALVSGAKPPRYTRESVEAALTSLADRIRRVNDDHGAGFTIEEAVVFGDILSDKARVQAANVGIRLTLRKEEPETTAAKHVAVFFKELRGKSALPCYSTVTDRPKLRLAGVKHIAHFI
jgi:hypothetical protein